MAWGFRGAWAGVGAGSPETLVLSVSGLATGDTIIIGAGTVLESATITPTNSGTAISWQTIGPYNRTAGNLRDYVFYGVVGATPPTTITLTGSAASMSMQVVAIAFLGMEAALVDLFDGYIIGQSNGYSHDVAGTLATSQPDVILVSFTDALGTGDYTPGSGFVEPTLTSGSLPSRVFLQYRSVTSQGSYSTPSTSLSYEKSTTIAIALKVEMGLVGGITGDTTGLMYALSGVMRSGASRSDYYAPNIFVTIGGQDWTSRVLKKSALIEENIDAIPNTANLDVIADAQFSETTLSRSGVAISGLARSGYSSSALFRGSAGPEIIIGIGTSVNRLFAGYVLNLRTRPGRKNRRRPRMQLGCVDYTWLIDRYRVRGKSWVSTDVSTIVSELVGFLPAGQGFTTDVQEGLGTITFSANHLETVGQALNRLTSRVGARWDVDYYKQVKVFRTADAVNAPTALTPDATHFWGLEIDSDLSPTRTRAYVIGGSTATTGVVAVGSTTIAVDDTRLFGASGGEALIGSNSITYTAKSTPDGPGNLTGVPASGDGSVLYEVAQGEPVRVLVVVDDVDAQAALTARIGANSDSFDDDGVVGHVVQDQRMGDDAAQGAGEAELLLYSGMDPRISYFTRDKQAQPGKAVTSSLRLPVVLNGTFMIQSTQITQLGVTPNKFPLRRVRAGGVRVDLEQILAATVKSDIEF